MLVRFLMQNLDGDCFKNLLEKACRKPEIIPPNWNPRTHEIGDLVLVKVFVRAGEIFWDKDVLVSNDENGFSAMQKATGFGISSVAKIMAEGKLEGDWQEHRDYWTPFPNNLSYKHVPFEDFNDNLLALGLTL
jgi:saccharopine dehydrogenase-like NADP-dependent oxidoreductase